MSKTYYRSIWISDAHLGLRDSQGERLLRFLRSVECDYVYLVGDMIDLWQIKRRWYWPGELNGIVRRLLNMVENGTEVYFLPGNHDDAFRDWLGVNFGGIEIRDRVIHQTADRRRLLVLHGDEFDTIVQCRRWLAKLGAAVYDYLVMFNRAINAVRRKFGLPQWSLAAIIKRKVKSAVSCTESFEDAAVHAAHRVGVDGIICGHIHNPSIRHIKGLTYHNCGDWVENCSAIVEDHAGELSILRYSASDDLDQWQGDDDLAELDEVVSGAASPAQAAIALTGIRSRLPVGPRAGQRGPKARR